MHVASLELCRELHQLSGWYGTSSLTQYWVYQPNITGKRRNKRDLWRVENIRRINEDYGVGAVLDTDTFTPAYPLGYLLRKLPNYIPTYGDDGDDYLLSLKPNFEGNEWEAAYWGLQKALYWNRADTPEDALCKLAIELFKQGVLTK